MSSELVDLPVAGSTAAWTGVAVEVELYRDDAEAVRLLPGGLLARRRLTGPWVPAAAAVHAAGARYARITRPVHLCPDADAWSGRTLVLVRELTARGIAVDWTARCTDGCVSEGTVGHLYPPATVDCPATAPPHPPDAAGEWRRTYFASRCVHRRGPGFVEVRDRRSGSLELYTIDEPAYLAAIDAMVEGVPVDQVPAAAYRELSGARLVAEQAGHLWWLPTRPYRWPFPALIV